MVFAPAPAHRGFGALVLLFLGNVAPVGTSLAQTALPAQTPRSVTVSYADLNLSSEEGARRLYKRLVHAAERVCPEDSGSVLTLKANREARKCIAEAVERAAQQIQSPRFAEVAAAQKR